MHINIYEDKKKNIYIYIIKSISKTFFFSKMLFLLRKLKSMYIEYYSHARYPHGKKMH